MADDITYPVPTSTKQVTDEHATRGHMPVVKLGHSADGSATHVQADADGLLVNLGANNDVNVSTLPPIPAGTNNIGDVDVLTLPATFAEDAVHSSGATGMLILGVRRDADTTPVNNDGDYHAFQFDEFGNVKVAVKVGAGSGGTQYTEDAAATPDPIGNALMLVREDARAGSLTTTDGDNVAARGNNKGEQYVIDTDANAKLTTITGHVDGIETTLGSILTELGQKTEPGDTQPVSHAALTELAAAIDTEVQCDIVGPLPAGTNAIGKLAANSGVDIGDVDVTSVTPGTGATSLGKAIDSVVGATDTGVMVLAVRDDATTTLTEADGDFTPLRTNSRGELRVDLSTRLDVAQDSVAALGNVGHDAVDAGAPVKVGFRADSTFQAAVADGDRVDALADVYGVQRVRDDHPNSWSYHEDSSSALTDAEVKAAPGSGLSIYITDISVSTGAATALNFFFEEGSTKIYGPIYLEAVAGRGYVVQFKQPKKVTANTAVTITTSAAIAHSIDIQGYIAP